MGGYGSGRRCTNELETTYRKLDIRFLAREGVLAAGCECSVQWSGCPLELLLIQAGEDELHFRYDTNPQSWQRGEVDLPIKLEWTPCNYGGRRPWFLCPRRGCGRRVAILYGSSDFGCRTCRRLTYHTQRTPAASRSLERAQRLRVRLGGNVDMTQPFPARPKGMHFLTYMKRAMRAWRAEDQANADLLEWLDSIQRRP
jgi:hypothetical protein